MRTELNNLQNKLSTLRHGFIEKHGSEPSVSLRYSDQSCSSSTIRLGVGDELNRSNYNSVPDGTASASDANRSSHIDETTNVNSSSSSSLNQADIASTSCDNMNRGGQSNLSSGGENEIDFSSNDEMMPEVASRVEKSSSDVELDYSDSDDDNRETMGKHSEQYVGRIRGTNMFEPHVQQKYIGHRNARYVKSLI